MNTCPVPLLPGAAALEKTYRAWFCDVWGVVHNGVAAFPAAVDALVRYRKSGGRVILITNAPRPAPTIITQLEALNVPREAFDGVVTSGDVTRDLLSRLGDTPVIHLGPDRDKPLLEGLELNFAPLDRAEILLCTGLKDDTVETPDDYTDTLASSARRGATMICANPDLVVHRGSTLVYCAGSLAAVYENLGGRVVYSGKPHAPIYELCMRRLGEIVGHATEKSDILAVGDGLRTDILGARQAGIPSLYVADGIHRQDILGDDETPEQGRLDVLFADENQPPVAAVYGLSW